MIARFKELRSARHIILVATHDLETAEQLLDRAIVLRDGRLVAVETDVQGLRARYQAHLRSAVAAL